MPTVRDAIAFALRQAKILPPGDAPTDDEASDGLTVVLGMYEAWVAGGMFGRLDDIETATAYEAKPGERVRVTGGATVTLPTGIAECGTTRPVYDLSLVEIVDADNGARAVHVYDAQSGGWVRLDGLTLSSDAPLATRGRDGLSACVALAWAEAFGAEIPPSVVDRARRFTGALSGVTVSQRKAESADYY